MACLCSCDFDDAFEDSPSLCREVCSHLFVFCVLMLQMTLMTPSKTHPLAGASDYAGGGRVVGDSGEDVLCK